MIVLVKLIYVHNKLLLSEKLPAVRGIEGPCWVADRR